jgi:aminopeptidase N
MLLCEKLESKSIDEWIYQYNNAPLLIDRKEALDGLKPHLKVNEQAYETVLSSLNDENDIIRKKTINSLEAIAEEKEDEVAGLLIQVAKNDKSSKVRAAAVSALGDYYNNEKHAPVFIAALKDSSYKVMEDALISLSMVDKTTAMSQAKNLEKAKNKNIQTAVSEVYAQHGDSTVHGYFIERSKQISGYEKYSFTPAYVDYLSKPGNTTPEMLTMALPILASFDGSDYFKQFYTYLLIGLSDIIKSEQTSIDSLIKASSDPRAIESLTKKKKDYSEVKVNLDELIEKYKSK